jgi:hypothetical protein
MLHSRWSKFCENIEVEIFLEVVADKSYRGLMFDGHLDEYSCILSREQSFQLEQLPNQKSRGLPTAIP